MYIEITRQAKTAVTELLDVAKLESDDIFVVGCSTSEVAGHSIGTYSSSEVATALFTGIYPLLQEKGLHIAAQCCEHLNRALILEKSVAQAYGLSVVNALPQPKAGGSFATVTYETLQAPVAVEAIQAKAGIDIGLTLIGMHLAPVAVPVRLSLQKIGEAHINCARVRPKFVGGSRAAYDEALL